MLQEVELHESPPMPANGTGDVIVDADGRDVLLNWKDSTLTSVRLAQDEEGVFLGDMKMTRSELGFAPTCWKCVFVDGVMKQCWIVPC